MSLGFKLRSFARRLTPDFSPLNHIDINSTTILNNFDQFQKISPHVWPVLKSNAYGHGIHQIVQSLAFRQFDYFVVDSYYEAQKIWQISSHPVLLIGETLPANFPHMDFHRLALMVQNRETLLSLTKPATIHLKVNTGMNRQGIDKKDLPWFLAYIKGHPHLKLEGLFSHLADADGPSPVYTDKQLKRFKQVISAVKSSGFNPRFIHLAATYGAPLINDPRINAIRLGLGLYGYGPLPDLHPALRFSTTVIKISQVKKGDLVGYNCTYKANKDMTIAVIPVGYHEGLDRRLSNCGFVKYQGKFCPIIGRVCMNLSVIDVSSTKPHLYDSVEVISPNPLDKNSVPAIASLCHTIPYDILVHFNESIRRSLS